MTSEELLYTAKELLKEEITTIAYDTWIKNMKINKLTDDTIILVAESDIHKDFIYGSYLDLISNTFKYITKKAYRIEILSQNEIDAVEAFDNKDDGDSNSDSYNISNLNPKYTFDTFVVGQNNNIAQATALAVSENPYTKYNPLFIYGGVGLGKTHLMHAIGNQTLEYNKDAKILYVTSERFLNDLVYSIKQKSNKTELFRKKYRDVDLFLMDDVQFLSGKEAAQTELFHTFNELHENKKQIVFSADRPPKDIPILEERLKSRFNWGLTVDVGLPDYETRLAILQRKSEEENFIIDNEILKFIAEKNITNIRDLEGILNNLIAYSSLLKSDITKEIAEKVVNEISMQNEKIITPDIILNTVSNYFNLSIEDLKSSKRSNEIAFPRQIGMYLCRTLLGLPYATISKIFNRKDHTTVMYAENKIKEEIKTTKETKLIVDSLTKILNDDKA